MEREFSLSPIGTRESQMLATPHMAYGRMQSAGSPIWLDNGLSTHYSVPNPLDSGQLRHGALSRCDNEGGATLGGHQERVIPGGVLRQ